MRLLGSEHADTGTAYNNLANNFSYRKLYAESVANYRTALAIRRKALGNQAADTQTSIEGLADSLAALAAADEAAGKWDAARKARQEVATLRSERWGEQDARAVDARWALKDIELISKLTADQRAALAKADDEHNRRGRSLPWRVEI